jgi:hypothetical protein
MQAGPALRRAPVLCDTLRACKHMRLQASWCNDDVDENCLGSPLLW